MPMIKKVQQSFFERQSTLPFGTDVVSQKGQKVGCDCIKSFALLLKFDPRLLKAFLPDFHF
eukprot:m.313185 g.313185  ORF g.313185 m.313185 type:complete len:61 (+) comp358213_c0_seq1:205-387(+)